MAEQGFLNFKTIIRMGMVFSLLYFFPSLGFLPGDRGPGKSKCAGAAFDPENGMGMPYAENNVLAVPAGLSPDTLAGMPEPELYSKPQALFSFAYKVRQGDTIGQLAQDFGLNQDTLLSMNGIRNSRLLQIGQMLKIPNQDGILYTVKKGDTLAGIAERYETEAREIQTVNELFSEKANTGTVLFIPGARLDETYLQEINGDLFLWPVRGYITSPYGYRGSPFTGERQFHSGLDIGAVTGTPIKAAMAGRVSSVGYDSTSGNYVVITHHSGYRTLYAHMNIVRVKSGAYVRTGDHIGDVGSTGLSTGPHLHFTVYKNGVTVNPRSLMR
ncbi:MAG: M23 family metallopeptidase [Spirochaetaceae bacterium]|nr:M23 family metallopeptidase [Spirochaetaceae bacterium]